MKIKILSILALVFAEIEYWVTTASDYFYMKLKWEKLHK